MPLLARLRVSDDRGYRRIHWTGNVAHGLLAGPVPADGTLVVQRPARVVASQPTRGGIVIGSITRLIAERPQDHRTVVLVASRQSRDSIDPGRQIARIVA